jgi:hypothetical protein
MSGLSSGWIACSQPVVRSQPQRSRQDISRHVRLVTGRAAACAASRERAQRFQLRDQLVLGGDHAVGAVALALEVRPVTGRAFQFGGEVELEFSNACLECGDLVDDRLRTTR